MPTVSLLKVRLKFTHMPAFDITVVKSWYPSRSIVIICCQTISKASAVERLCRKDKSFVTWLMNANTDLPAFVRSKKFCSLVNQTAGNSWEMTLKNAVPSICLSLWLIAAVVERSDLVLHKCDLRLFCCCVGGKKIAGIFQKYLKGVY